MSIQVKTVLSTMVAASWLMLEAVLSAPSQAIELYNNLDLEFEDGLSAAGSDRRFAQQFNLGNSIGVEEATLSLFGGQDSDVDFGMPTGEISVEVWEDEGGLPSFGVGTLGTLDLEANPIVSLISQLETFDNPVLGLNANEPYWIVLSYEQANVDFDNSIGWNTVSSAVGTNGAAKGLASRDSGETWDVISEALESETLNYFQMSVEGVQVPEPSTVLGTIFVLGVAATAKRL